MTATEQTFSITTDMLPFLAAIRAAPADDAPRLVFADWLDENGYATWAELIRVQCELARLQCETAQHPTFAGGRNNTLWRYLNEQMNAGVYDFLSPRPSVDAHTIGSDGSLILATQYQGAVRVVRGIVEL